MAATHETRRDELRAPADDAPVVIWAADVDGGWVWCNRAWLELTGRPPAEHVGDGWIASVHGDDVERYVGAYREALGGREPFEADVRVCHTDGTCRWVLTRAAPRHDANGAFVGYAGTGTDITERHNREARLQVLAAAADVVAASFDLDATLQRVARLVVPAFAELCTIGVTEHDGRVRRVAIAHADAAEESRLRALDDEQPLTVDGGSALAEVARSAVSLYRPLVDAPGPDEPWPPTVARTSDRDRSLVVAPLVGSRGTVGAFAMAALGRRLTPDDVVLAHEVAHRCAAAVEQATLYRESEERRERLALLASIGEQLASSLEVEETTRIVADRVVPVIADFVIVAVGERKTLRRVAVRHVDRERERAFRSRHAGATIDLDSALPVARATATGKPVIIESVPSPSRTRANHDPLAPLRELGVTSLIAVPLCVDDAVVGGMLFGYATSGRRYNASDVTLTLDIARRLALAVERARTFVAERNIAETLQRRFLPDELPDVPLVGLCARYLPGGRAEVGGDWYDVVPLAEGRVAVVIGDVAGHGVRAAAVMGQLRNALRAFAGEGYAPAALVERCNRFVFENGPSDMATLCYAVVDPRRGTVQWVSAGHPPPVVAASGDARLLTPVGGPPVGADPRSKYREHELVLAPGDTLLLYTDGLIERRGESLDVGLDRLLDAARSAPEPAELARVCDHLITTLVPGGRADDDVAVLAVRYVGRAPAAFRWRRPARAEELATMRRVVSAWLESAGVPRDDITLIAVAVSEAATNAIEHAYGRQEGWFEIEASRAGDDVVISVRDAGRWRPKASGGGGRGLGLIGRLMDEFELRRTDQGTEVFMRRSIRARNEG